MKALDISGQTYGRLTAVRQAGHNIQGRLVWLFKCSCGQEVTATVGRVRAGHTKSCGCLKVEQDKLTHRTHGATHAPEYSVWQNMKRRCLDPKNKFWDAYGGRGIGVCKRWMQFENFLKDMGKRPAGLTLDRKDNEKGYTKANCRWATTKQQRSNRRDSK